MGQSVGHEEDTEQELTELTELTEEGGEGLVIAGSYMEGGKGMHEDAGSYMCGQAVLEGAVLEGATAFVLSICIWVVLNFNELRPLYLIFCGLVFFWHLWCQFLLSLADPWDMGAILRSLGEDWDHAETTMLFDELRHSPPSVRVTAQAYQVDHNCELTVDHSEVAEFRFASWSDVSGDPGLNKHAVAAIRVVPAIECADPATVESFHEHEQRLIGLCKSACPEKGTDGLKRHNPAMMSGTRLMHWFSVHHSTCPIEKSRWDLLPTLGQVKGEDMGRKTQDRVIVTRRPGVKHACWMSASTYHLCRFAFPFFGTIYRLLVLNSMSIVQYRVAKLISVHSKNGGGWV